MDSSIPSNNEFAEGKLSSCSKVCSFVLLKPKKYLIEPCVKHNLWLFLQDLGSLGSDKTYNCFPASLVPDYMDSDSNEDDVPGNTMRRQSTSSSSTSCSTCSSSSSSDSSSSSSSSISTNKPATEQNSKITNLSPTGTLVADSASEDVIENTPESDLQRSSGTRRLVVNSPIITSPVYTDESDIDDDVFDPTYNFEDKFANAAGSRPRNLVIQSSSENSSTDSDVETQRRGRKRIPNPKNWKQNKVKRLRNQGKSYISMSKTRKNITARCLKIPCTTQCRLKCTEKINDAERYELFDQFWQLGDLNKQRAFINSSMVEVHPKYKYTNTQTPRRPNKAYYLTVDSKKIRVCKMFFKSTLDITDRMIYTIQTKTNESGFLLEDLRGKHGKHKKLSTQLLDDIRKHIDSIPRIESHYMRAATTRQYIDGSKTIKDLYNDFATEQVKKNKETGNYIAYYKVFNTDFNLSFFQPKKDQCDVCVAYVNSNEEQRKEMEEKYQKHLKEKELSRIEKQTDRRNIDEDNIVTIYDLEAVLPCPRGETSAFYYKSKLNSYNLTLTELTNKVDKKKAYDNVHCYFWTESDAKRGAIEIGTCIWNYLKELSKSCEEEHTEGKNIIFYSDNCCGQNKNKFIATMYLYAVHYLNINSITHKFLIRGHTQNEADSVHSLIEREVKKNLKSGPIYSPDQYITLIKNAKKSRPAINVHELTFDSFMNIKSLQEDWGYNFHTDTNGQSVNWNELKQLKMTKGNPFTFYYKTSYGQNEYKEVNVRNKRKKMKLISEIVLKNAYTQKQELSANKKKDLKELLTKGLIPAYYANFYNSIV